MFERLVSFEPAFERRHANPAQDYGIGSVTLRFVLRGEHGAVDWLLFTNWYLPETRANLGDEFPTPGPQVLTYHSLREEDGPYQGPCAYLDGRTCYMSTQYYAADSVLERLLREGDAGVWAALADAYMKQFGQTQGDTDDAH